MKTQKYAQPVSRRINRRKFALGLGAGLVAAPFIRPLLSSTAHAAEGDLERLFLFQTQGTKPIPFTSIDWSQGGLEIDHIGWKMLGSTSDKLVFNHWQDNLESIKDKLLVMEGLHGGNDNHGSRHPLLGGPDAWGKSSIDHLISDHLIAGGTSSAIPVLLVGSDVKADGGYSFREGERLPFLNDPVAAHSLVFEGVVPGGAEPGELADMNAKGQSILDAVKGDLDELYSVLGTEERSKLDAHLESVRQYEKRLSTGSTVATESCQVPELNAGANNTEVGLMQLEIAKMALACDITRVVVVQWGNNENSNEYRVTVPEVGWENVDLHTEVAHGIRRKGPEWHLYENWQAGKWRDIVESLAATAAPDSGGSILDSTAVIWTREMGDSDLHTNTDQRIVVASGSPAFQMGPDGRYHDGKSVEASYTQALLTILQAYGITNLDGFGEEGGDRSPIAGLLG